jgi:hypothetical protein
MPSSTKYYRVMRSNIQCSLVIRAVVEEVRSAIIAGGAFFSIQSRKNQPPVEELKDASIPYKGRMDL